MCAWTEPSLACPLKWSYLSQHSSPMMGGMEGSRGDDLDKEHRQLSRGQVSTEVQEQVEVWILDIEKKHTAGQY